MNAFQLVMQLLPVAEQAIDIICKADGITIEQAFNQLISHITAGQPNSAALSPTTSAKS